MIHTKSELLEIANSQAYTILESELERLLIHAYSLDCLNEFALILKMERPELSEAIDEIIDVQSLNE